jgi:MutS-like protein
MLLMAMAGVTLAVLLAPAVLRFAREQRLARIRANWGNPVHRTRRLDGMAASHRSRIAATRTARSLDDRTWSDLDLDAVFAAIDRTQSTLGQHALYHRLRTSPVGDHLAAFEALVTRMERDRPARERAQLALDRLQDPQGYDIWWLAAPDAVEQRWWYPVFPLLFSATILAAALGPFWSPGFMPLVALIALNVAIRYGTDPHVRTIALTFRQCAPLIATAGELQFLTGTEIDSIVGGLRSELPVLRRLKLISRWINGNPFMLSTGSGSLAIALSDLVAAVYEYLNLALLLDGTGLYFGLRDLSRGGGSLVRVVAAAGEVDAAISVASYRAGRQDWIHPEFLPGAAATDLIDVCHPLLQSAVPNSITVKPAHGVLVTGSNMSGKSTFLRTVGVNAILAQTINTCLAREYRAPIFHVRSCIGRADDILTGTSYYIAEVEALLELVRASAGMDPHLFVLDELFRGTNAVERIAAGQAVLTQLLQGTGGGTKPHLVLAATHDLELVELAAGRYEPYHFGDSMGPDGLVFDHRLQRGPSTSRNAIALLRLHGAPDALITRAMATAAMLDEKRARIG